MFLEMQEIKVVEGDVWGHRKDISEYYEIPAHVVDNIYAMSQEGHSDEDVINRFSRERKLSSDIVSYILSKR